eukprot:TRINITY_DN3717_c0_g2_i5.p1 TRINITY_DN3717_c0_g2~~TRINITY_DN3717_c0_g2_i5.p1  ORF type:complete len:194 (-),score=41.39 TRINITY_DN3717_c0_g2_i5:741-1322(-)
MGDVKDILGIKRVQIDDNPLNRIKRRRSEGPDKTAAKKKRKTGLDRELEELTKEMPSLAPATELPKLDKPKLIKQKVDKWVWKPFHNSARTDGFTFCHWAKAKEEIQDSPFAKYSRKIVPIMRYTEAQYKQLLSGRNENGWSKEETDYLMDLSARYDTRFIVIQDRWAFPTKRSVEVFSHFFCSCHHQPTVGH